MIRRFAIDAARLPMRSDPAKSKFVHLEIRLSC